MSDWAAGYMAEIPYTFGYFGELNPQYMRLALLHAGLVPPDVGLACELGFGQGVSVNMHAAASSAEWHGTDFFPAHTAFAREVAMVSGARVNLKDDSFADFAQRPELPDFDFIGLHGIWSWVSDENRRVIVDFVRRKLKAGGVLYVSYNTQPGWAAFAPIQRLMSAHSDAMGSPADNPIQRVDAAVNFVQSMLDMDPAYSRANPNVGSRFEAMKQQDRRYLAHEYFNRNWQAMHFLGTAEWLGPAKVEYACSAHYFDLIDVLNLNTEQQQFLEKIPDANFRQGVRDFLVNQPFRRDYWVKGGRKLSAARRDELLRAHEVLLVKYRAGVSLKVSGSVREVTMSEKIYGPLLDILADHQRHSLRELEAALKPKEVSFTQLVQAIMILIGAGHVACVQDSAVATEARKRTKLLNAHLVEKARVGNEIGYLASPVTGGAIAVRRIHQLCVLGLSQGLKQPHQWAAKAWETLASQGEHMMKDGKVLLTVEQNMDELTSQALEFAHKRLPILKALNIV
jgi:SAM-dependent methyltransferase